VALRARSAPADRARVPAESRDGRVTPASLAANSAIDPSGVMARSAAISPNCQGQIDEHDAFPVRPVEHQCEVGGDDRLADAALARDDVIMRPHGAGPRPGAAGHRARAGEPPAAARLRAWNACTLWMAATRSSREWLLQHLSSGRRASPPEQLAAGSPSTSGSPAWGAYSASISVACTAGEAGQAASSTAMSGTRCMPSWSAFSPSLAVPADRDVLFGGRGGG